MADRLAAWFAKAGRDLPWRRRRDGYRALVSELMLQQTQVSRVVERFEAFVARFPDPATLAAADESAVLAAWQGLGYYRRARLLHAAAREIVARHAGAVPDDPDALLALPGVGRYTSGAVSSIAFGRRAPIVDGNVVRVFQRLAARPGHAGEPAIQKWAWREAEAFVRDAREPGKANEALMELGATVCTPLSPRCGACPVRDRCAAFARGTVDRIPAPKIRAARRELVLVATCLWRSDGATLLEQRPASGLWARLWQPPTIEYADGGDLSREAVAALLGLPAAVALEPRGEVPFATTHRSIRFIVFRAAVRGMGARMAAGGRRWAAADGLGDLALSNAAKAVLAAARPVRA